MDFLFGRQFQFWGGLFALHPCLWRQLRALSGSGGAFVLVSFICQRTFDIQQMVRILPILSGSPDGIDFHPFRSARFHGFFCGSVRNSQYAGYAAPQFQDMDMGDLDWLMCTGDNLVVAEI